MKVYISIPISGCDRQAQELKAREMADMFRSAGHEAVNPFETPAPPEDYTPEQEYAWYMGRDIEQLLTCQAICLCTGWSTSRGCRMEVAVAKEAGLWVYYE